MIHKTPPIPFGRKLNAAKQNEKGKVVKILRKTQKFVSLSLLISLCFNYSGKCKVPQIFSYHIMYVLTFFYCHTFYTPDQSGKGMLQHFSAWRQCRHCRTAILAAFLFFRRSATAAAVGICRSRPEKRGIGHGSSGWRGHSYYVILTACDVTLADVTSAGAGWNL